MTNLSFVDELRALLKPTFEVEENKVYPLTVEEKKVSLIFGLLAEEIWPLCLPWMNYPCRSSQKKDKVAMYQPKLTHVGQKVIG